MTSSTYDRNQTELEILRNDPATYCTIPEGRKYNTIVVNDDALQGNLVNMSVGLKTLIYQNNKKKYLNYLYPPAV